MADKNVAFVAKSFIEQSPPPPATTGPIGWIRANLFSGVVNSILTIAAIAIIAMLVPPAFEWAFVDSVWNVNSLAECRATRAIPVLNDLLKASGADADMAAIAKLPLLEQEAALKKLAGAAAKGVHVPEGACWAVIVERFDQFIYGFYPKELRWRSDLAFILLVVAVAYALFDGMPFRNFGLIYAAVYPIIAYFLIWGGSLWVIPAALLGIVPAVLAYRAITRRLDALATLLVLAMVGLTSLVAITAFTALAGAIVVWLIAQGLALVVLDFDVSIGGFVGALIAGNYLVLVVLIALGAIAAGLFGAYYVARQAMARSSAVASTYAVAAFLAWLYYIVGPTDLMIQEEIGRFGFVEVESRQLGGFLLAIIIGVAGIVLSLPIGILLALGRRSGMIFIQTICIVFIEFIRGVPLITLLFVANSVLAYFFPPGSNLDLILRVVIMVVLFASAYMAETIRGGLAALPQGQYEAADSLGLDYWKSMRLIILPQALKISIPNIVSNFIGLFKDTTLVTVIGLLDPVGLVTTIRGDSNWNGIVWEFYVFVGLFFFVFCFGMSRYSRYLERKLATDHR